MILHAGLIALFDRRRWQGVLIRGPSGSGKSDLALRAMRHGFRLVADDRVLIFGSCGRLFGRAPRPLIGLIEIRGLGVATVETLSLVEVCLVVDCVGSRDVERMPEALSSPLLGIETPTMAIRAFDASAPAKLCRALEVLGRARQQDYDAAFPQTAPRGSS
jgi:serine kinase of HPr protein (carbohydrate metabolism regulator)